jgi:hypothetical protein
MDFEAFGTKWKDSAAAEKSNSQPFLVDLCDYLGVPRPNPSTGDPARDAYVFEKDAKLVHPGGKSTVGKMDLYREGHFILESKQGSHTGSKKHGTAKRDTPEWWLAMERAHGQAVQYAATLASPPPFIITCDVGWFFEVFACFDGSRTYQPFPNPQASKIFFSDLPKHAATFKKIWTDPLSLDPSKIAAKVTTDVAKQLAKFAKSLEAAGHAPDVVAMFVMRCLFTMFAEDVGLLPDRAFTDMIEKFWLPNPGSFPGGIELLWHTMNDGGHTFTGKLLKFNGGLFANPVALPLTKEQLGMMLEASKSNWADVEPAIFGTLLERALNPKERHKLGAHFTPRAYVERLVRPTIDEPLRADWDVVRAEVQQLVGVDADDEKPAKKGKAGGPKKIDAARKLVKAFHQRLCSTTVLDPACGSGNFLYVAMELMKRLESEVLEMLAGLGDKQTLLDVHGVTVNPAQFHGIEVNKWAKEIAELVIWIGYLQWHGRTRRGSDGKVLWPEPVLKDLKNIENRDALLEWDGEPEIVRDEATGEPITRWDGATHKKHPVTGEDVPDERARVPIYRYKAPRKAAWPDAEFVVGNPPFLGKLRIMALFGEGYAAALRETYEGEVPDSADFVMYWWWRAAQALRAGRVHRFGFITTNSIVQTFNRRIVAEALADGDMRLTFAIPDHPWVESSDGAAVRIAMTVGARGGGLGTLLRVVDEEDREGETALRLEPASGAIHPNLRIGAAVAAAVGLRANSRLASMGPMLGSRGFLLSSAERDALVQKDGLAVAQRLRPLRSGRDLATRPRGVFAIDLHGLALEEARTQFPAVYQHVFTTVYPERAQNNDPRLRARWWLFRRSNDLQRAMVEGLRRFIVTAETAKFRVFMFESAQVLAEHGTVTIGLDDAYFLGVVSARIHEVWALAAGGRMGIGNDPRYNKTVCFDPFPFPDCDEPTRARIRGRSEALDAHRKKQQEQHPDLTITGMYNVRAKLRAGELLNEKERAIHETGLVSILKQIHDDLDAAVFAAYGWPVDLSDEQILERVVALNAKRAEEERNGLIRWLRPDFQNPAGKVAAQAAIADDGGNAEDEQPVPGAAAAAAWPKKLPEQIAAVRDLVGKSASPWSAEQVAASYKGAKRDDVGEVLDTLSSLGLLVAFESEGGTRYTGTGRVAA